MAANAEAPAEQDVQAMILQCFQNFDQNQDGIISREELARVLRALDESKFDDATISQVLVAADADKDGNINYAEFVDWVMSDKQSKAAETNRPINYRGMLPARFQVELSDRYAVNRTAVGEGGYGQVFVARDAQQEGRVVAIKKVVKSKDRNANQAFLREVAIMKDLDHPNICKLFEVFEEGANLFFVLEFCEGGEVFDRIIKDKFISEANTAQIIQQVASALRYTHGRRIAHRDIKPENIVFCTKDPNDNNVKLIDWGLGVSFASRGMKAAVGSFTYAAPEVVQSRNAREYTAACDLWSLGVVTYVMLSGKPPFWGTEKQHLRNALAERYPLRGGIWEQVSRPATDFIRSLLKADPARRLGIQQVVEHEWLVNTAHPEVPVEISNTVVSNLQNFQNTSSFGAICMTAVARQLDHRSLKDIHAVFREIDTNGDGVLSLEEINQGFGRMLGEDSADYRQVVDTFHALDLDQSASIDYTEFCAAALGQHDATKDEAVWSAFKLFDIDNTGKLSRDEVQKVLQSMDVQRIWTSEVCQDVSDGVFTKYDRDGDDQIDFQEFMDMMHDSWNERKAEGGTAGTGAPNAYDLLIGVSGLAAANDNAEVMAP